MSTWFLALTAAAVLLGASLLVGWPYNLACACACIVLSAVALRSGWREVHR